MNASITPDRHKNPAHQALGAGGHEGEMPDTHPTYQKVLYLACWVILTVLVLIALGSLIGG